MLFKRAVTLLLVYIQRMGSSSMEVDRSWVIFLNYLPLEFRLYMYLINSNQGALRSRDFLKKLKANNLAQKFPEFCAPCLQKLSTGSFF
jgi:hypothetical protein